jgi:hypothetical protein
MLRSFIIECDGHFLGAAVRASGDADVHFVAVHDSVRPLQNTHWHNVAAASQAAGRMFRVSRHATSDRQGEDRSEPDGMLCRTNAPR